MKNNPREEPRTEKLDKDIERLYREKQEDFEQKEEKEQREFSLERERMISEKLKEEEKKIKLAPDSEKEAQEKASEINILDKKAKIKRLLGLAEEKGVLFAVRVAKGLDDPYTLDVLHDILAREGFYKKFNQQ